MRTARTLFASAVITAAFAVGAPTATASPAAVDGTTVSATSAHHGDHGRHWRGDRDRYRDHDHGRFCHHWHGRHHHMCRHHHHSHHYRSVGGMHTRGGARVDVGR
ncbi:hypothetical protein RM550_03265 [Streptomyces sp. DSM 41527]|uniref:Uncharacterized protein n=1 Tax=Streptomyces mooreae TaxID=3075523 RepID=A0ABU2T0L0_9ACTN|nr:hypothetical protein [Streptomyces sp. DSM 41527]MDT0454761.1 hypothetical protein [Streptomyces sp. DSM 41527]